MDLSISILITVAAFCVLTAVLYLSGFIAKRKALRPPLNRDVLLRPGQPLLAELDMIKKDLQRYGVFAVLFPTTIFAVHLLQSYLGGAKESGARLVVSAVGGLLLCLFAIYKMIRLFTARRATRLAYTGLLAVNRELERLVPDGFHIYPDFPAQPFDIDHVVVGPIGVFAVKTKTHSRPASKNLVEDATASYDGRMLYFPKAEDFKTIDEAQQQALWLSDWLGKAIGEPIAARAIVALPGWFVKRTSAEGIPVVNPHQFSSLFKHIKPRPLSDALIARINHQLDKEINSSAI